IFVCDTTLWVPYSAVRRVTHAIFPLWFCTFGCDTYAVGPASACVRGVPVWNAAEIVLIRLSELTNFASRTATKLNHLHCKAYCRHPRGAHSAKTTQGCCAHSVD